MVETLLAPQNLMFSLALILMLLIGLVEALGFGFSALADVDFDVAETAPVLSWLDFSRLPLLMLLVAFLASFGLSGLALQQLVASWSGQMLSASAAAIAAAVIALPLTSLVSRGLARVLPADETSAVGLDTLLGRRGRVILGSAEAGYPARARVRDAFGQSHYVLVEPNLPGERLAEGDEILLVARKDGHFRAIAVAPHINLEEEGAAE